MRYSIRTLLILTTLCCVYATWVGYLRKRVEYHRQESARIIKDLAMRSEMEAGEVETLVTNIASKSRGRVDSLHFNMKTPPEVASTIQYLEDEHRRAANHQILARTFGEAVWQPWKIVNARFAP